jgi:hypothetical protein
MSGCRAGREAHEKTRIGSANDERWDFASPQEEKVARRSWKGKEGQVAARSECDG